MRPTVPLCWRHNLLLPGDLPIIFGPEASDIPSRFLEPPFIRRLQNGKIAQTVLIARRVVGHHARHIAPVIISLKRQVIVVGALPINAGIVELLGHRLHMSMRVVNVLGEADEPAICRRTWLRCR